MAFTLEQPPKNQMLAHFLRQGLDSSPVQHWSQGLSRMAHALLGGMEAREEKENERVSNERLALLLGGQPTPTTAQPAAAPPVGFAPPAPPQPQQPPAGFAPPANKPAMANPPPDSDPTMTVSPRQVAQANAPAPAGVPSPAPPSPPGPMPGAPPMTSSAAPPDMQAKIAAMLQDPNPAIQRMGRQLATQVLATRMQPPKFSRLNDDALYDERTGRVQPIQGDFYRPITDPAERARYNIPPEDKRPYQLGPGGKLINPPAETRVNMSTVADPILTGVGEQITKARAAAREIPQQIQSIHEARRSLDEGAITGAVADWRLAAAKVFGIAPDQVANTEVFRASVGDQVLSSIKALGANPSNTDRDYIEKVKGGQITLDETSLRRILDIQEKYARQTLRTFNREAKTIMDTNPDAYRSISGVMQFEEPPEYAAPQRAAPGSGTSGGWQTQTLPNGRTIRIRPKQ